MNPKPSHWRELHDTEDREMAMYAERATSDTINGGASALRDAKESGNPTLVDVVREVYACSTGKHCETYGAWECDECGSVHVGRDAANECCADDFCY